MNWLRSKLSNLTADAIAFELSGVIPSLLKHLVLERKILGYSLVQMGVIAPLYAILRIVTSRMMGLYRDKLERTSWLEPMHQIWRKWLSGAIATTVFQIPIYTACALLVGVDLNQLAVMWCWFIAINTLNGGVYSYVLDWVRKGLLNRRVNSDRSVVLAPARRPEV